MPALSSVVASQFAPLPEADREAQNVAIQFRRSRLLSGPDVTSTAIRRELAQSDVFHFAGHAVSGVKKSGLVLATSANASQDSDAGEPTLLSAADLDTIVLRRLQLVVLSACATAETEKGFTGPDTLVRGFLRAGVPHVVASRWPVDSESTKQVMAKLYPYLLQGVPVDQALQQAADELRLQPATAHPYYWAAFGSYGR
jgi:CHAT domain-containing protein